MKKITPFLFIIAILCLAVKCDNNCTQCEADKIALQQQLQTCTAANATNQQKIATLTSELQTCNDENAINETKIISLTNELNECKTATDVYRAKINELMQQLEDCQSADTSDLTRQLAECQVQDSINQARIIDLTVQLQACNVNNTANQTKINELTEQLNVCIAAGQVNDTRIAELTQSLQACDADKIILNDSIIVLNDSIDKLNQTEGSTHLWAYSYIIKTDSTVFNFWYSSDASAPYQTRTSVGSLEFDQYYTIKGFERMFNKSSYTLEAGAGYLEVILYDSTFNKVLYTKQFDLVEMLPKTEYQFNWNTNEFTLPYVGKYYMSKVLYEKKFFKDRPLEGGYFSFTVKNNLHTALKMKTHPVTTPANIPNMKIYLNADTLHIPVKLDKVDSTYVVYINKAFEDIDSINFKTDVDLILKDAWLSGMDLLNNPAIKVKGVTHTDDVDKILVNGPEPASPLVARWRFENNGDDETGTYPLTVTTPANMFIQTSPAEGVYYMSFQGSTYYADAGIIPLGDEFTISFYFVSHNENSAARALLGNSKVYYPDGYVFYFDEIAKSVRFVTGDGTSESRKYIISTTGAWNKGDWVHIAITGSRLTGIGKVYINGVDKTWTSSTGIFKTFKTTTPLLLGRSSDPSQAWCYMDDSRIYNRMLTASEVTKLYNTGEIK
jgi:hypothetical protein